jgi:hypothetical protein
MAVSPGALSETQIVDWLVLIRAEYLEMPDLRLTLTEAQRLWGLDQTTSSALFGALVDARFLKRTRAGAYVRAATYEWQRLTKTP